MAVQVNFRTALNGFNREDVVRYIEYINAKHLTEVNQLNSELEYLRAKVQSLQSEAIAPAAPEAVRPMAESVAAEPIIPQAEPQEPSAEVAQLAGRVRELFDQCKQLEQERDTALTERDEALAERDDVLAQNSRLTADLEAAQNQHIIMQSRTEEELEAYRRAERTERLARERAEQMYRQANGALADATAKVDDTATLIGRLSDQVIQHLSELQHAVTDSKEALRDAAATMYTIRPTEENE